MNENLRVVIGCGGRVFEKYSLSLMLLLFPFHFNHEINIKSMTLIELIKLSNFRSFLRISPINSAHKIRVITNERLPL